MRKIKNLVISMATIITLVMMVATFVDNSKGNVYACEHIYNSVWFVALWAILACISIAYIIKRKLYKRMAVMGVHLSFLLILAGAFTSWLTSESGKIHIRKGVPVSTFEDKDGKQQSLGFAMSLKDFKVIYYPGTDAPMDYVSTLTTDDKTIEISMNSIGEHKGYRFTQASYDDDMQGSTLGLLYDPWGIGVTYVGYALLFLSLLVSIFRNKTRMQSFYKKAMCSQVAKTISIVIALWSCMFPLSANAQEQLKIDSKVYNKFGKICVLYNSRICPINTVATDFVTKLCGKPSWKGKSANEVFAGWVFDVPYWETVKMIEVKDKKVQELMGLSDKWASFHDFYNEYNEYKLESPLKDAYKKGDKDLQKKLISVDEKFNIIRMLYNGEMLKVFPYKNSSGHFTWIAPGESLKNVHLPEKELNFVMKSMDYLAESIITGDNKRAETIATKIYNYQHVRGREVIPSTFGVYCELFYNALNCQRWSIIAYLTLSLLVVIASTMALSEKREKRVRFVKLALIGIMLIHTTIVLALRWFISGHLPLSNGYETMQFMSWAVLILTIAMSKRFQVIRTFGPLLASFALLVAMITDSNPQITQLMPVLQSPLLSLHVMVIMFSYALFGLMALIGVQGIFAHKRHATGKEEQLAALSQFLLYPAITLLTIGIFIGAIWANVSWGKYWGWDSKEVWALITMIIYAAPLHSDIKWMGKPLHVHIYMTIAFLCVLMTYFGVNYFLTGMHSYA